MHWRGWIGVVGASVLGHMALFWPLPVIHFPDAGDRVLNVSLVTPVQPPGALPVEEQLKAGESALAGREAGEPNRGRSLPLAEGVGAVSLEASKDIGRSEDAGPLARPHAPEVSIASRTESVSLDSYRFTLAKEVLRLQRYPGQLLERGYGGIVELKISFPEPDRLPPAISVLASSGLQALDEAAVAAADEGVRNLPWPGIPGAVRLSVLFEADRAAPRTDPGVGGQR